MSHRLALLLCSLVAGASLGSVGAAGAETRASLPAIEREVMCVSCGVPLNIAESAQADRERAFIQGLIDQGRSEGQIKQALVGQFGPRVLATPSHRGFGLAAYLVPAAVGAAVLALLGGLLTRWRRRTRAIPSAVPSAARDLEPADAARLDADLARFDA